MGLEKKSQLLVEGLSRPSILENISLQISTGEMVGLVGPNGSGKTTLLKLIAGIYGPAFQNQEVKKITLREGAEEKNFTDFEKRAQWITYVGPQLILEFPIRVKDVVGLGRICHLKGFLGRVTSEDRDSIEWALDFTECRRFAERDVNSLSDGELQRVAIARALAQGSRFLLLDEAFSKMDLHHQVKMAGKLQTLVAKGLGILFVTHDLNLASEFSHRMILLKSGRIVSEGGPTQTVTERNIENLYPGMRFRIMSDGHLSAPRILWEAHV